MNKIEINGKIITTNYDKQRYAYPVISGNESGLVRVPSNMTIEEFFKESIDNGYTKISFYELTTSVRGYHHVVARRK